MLWLLLSCGVPAPSTPVAPPPDPTPQRVVLEVTLPLALGEAAPCLPACGRTEAVRQAVQRGLGFIEGATSDPSIHVNIDVLIALAAVRRVFASEGLDALWERVVADLDTGGDPRRRFWDPAHRMPADFPGHAWQPDPAVKASPNRLLVEALYCPELGFRPEAGRYACEVFRDDGGLMSAHAAWGLAVAIDQGCIPRGQTCLDQVRDELLAAALAEPALDTTLLVDTHAEQLVFALMSGADASALDPVVDRLLGAQRADGSWGVIAEGEDPWWGVHATLAAVWGMAAWVEGRAAP